MILIFSFGKCETDMVHWASTFSFFDIRQTWATHIHFIYFYMLLLYIYIYTYTLRYTYMYYVYHTFVRSHCFAFNFWMCFFLSLHLNEKFEKKRKKKTSKLLCVVCLCETKRINFCIYIITISHTNKTYSSHETWPSITLLCCPLLSILLLLIYYFSYKIEKKTRFSSKAIRCR